MSRRGLMMRAATLSIALGLMLGSAPARAQSRPASPPPSTVPVDRVFVRIDGGYRPAARSFTDTVRITQFVESGRIDTAYRVKAAPEFDAAVGVRFWRRLAVAVDVSYLTKAGGGAVTAQIPHPFFFGRLRSVDGGATGLTRQETAVHAQAVWMTPLGDRDSRWRLDLAGGPSVFHVGQDVVQNVTVTETYPFDTATLATVAARRVAKSAVGFNAGADLTYMLSTTVGVGTTVTFSRARIKLPLDEGHSLTIDAGGALVGAGLRFRF